MIKNKIYQTNPCFVHAAGKKENCPLWEEILEKNYEKKFSIPDDLEIITWNNDDSNYYKNLGTFENSIQKCQLRLNKLKTKKKWTTNRIKIELTLDFLNKTKSTYTLGADSADVVVVNNPENITKIFDYYKQSIIFNAEKNFWKPDILKKCFEYENKKYEGYFKFLNAGLWIGKTKNLIIFFEKTLSISKEYKQLPYSEQACVKIAAMNDENVGIDYKCIYFQCINGITKDIIEI